MPTSFITQQFLWPLLLSFIFLITLIHRSLLPGFSRYLAKLQSSVQLTSQSCLTVCDPMNCSTPGLSVHHQLLESTQTLSIVLVMPSNHLILCHLLLLLPSVFPSIRVFSNESALHIRWPKYWSFSFNISPTNEHQSWVNNKFLSTHDYII